MSDLFAVEEKVQRGADWRGEMDVTIDGDEHTLTYRQLVDPEMAEIMTHLKRDELMEMRQEMDAELLDEYRDLRAKDDLTDEEEVRIEEIAEEVAGDDSQFGAMDQDTITAIRKAAKYGVEPDDEDRQQALKEDAHRIEEEYGVQVREPEDVDPYLQDRIEEMIDNCQDFVSVEIGMEVLMSSMGDRGN